MGGSQKIPQRWLETLAFHARHGRHCDSTPTALAARLLHVRGDSRSVDDPMAKQLADIWAQSGEAGTLTASLGRTDLCHRFGRRRTMTRLGFSQ